MGARFLWLDLFRGLAALGVLSFHVVVRTDYTQLDGLYVLVDFFFVLSGFVMWPSMPHSRATWSKDAGRFIVKRFLRLWPMLIFAVIVSNVIYWITRYTEHPSQLLVGYDQNRKWTTVLAAAAMLQVIVSNSMFMIVPLWSLSAEWLTNLFYTPLTALRGNKGILYAIFAGYLALNIGLTMDRGWIDFIGPIRHFEALGRAVLGFGFGLLVRKELYRLEKLRNPVFLAVATYGVWWSFFSYQGFGYNNTYFVALIYAFFILQISKYELGGAHSFGKFAAFLGKYSYGIYVYHQIMIDATMKLLPEPQFFEDDALFRNYFIEKSAIVCFLSILATWVTHKVFEGPIQRWGAKKMRATS